jgi:uncharacterized protein (TIGR02246 family)
MLLALFVPGRIHAEAKQSDQTDQIAIERIVTAFIDAWNRHDMKALAALFAEDADFVNVIGLHWRGRAEIEKNHVAIHQTRMKNSQLRTTALSQRFLRPDVALAHATWQLQGDTGVDGKAAAPRRGILMAVVVKQGKGWTIAAAQNTDIVPMPGSPPNR